MFFPYGRLVAGDRVFVYFWSVELLRHTFVRLATARTRPHWSMERDTAYLYRRTWVVLMQGLPVRFSHWFSSGRAILAVLWTHQPCNFRHGALCWSGNTNQLLHVVICMRRSVATSVVPLCRLVADRGPAAVVASCHRLWRRAWWSLSSHTTKCRPAGTRFLRVFARP